MKNRLTTWITLALVLGSLALAVGRAGFRAEAQTGAWSVRGYVEQELFSLAGLEVWAGVDLRLPEMRATPYTLFSLAGDGWWVGIELARPIPGGGFRAALMGGLSWP